MDDQESATGNLESKKTQISARSWRNPYTIQELSMSVDKLFEELHVPNIENVIVNMRDNVDLVVGMVEWAKA